MLLKRAGIVVGLALAVVTFNVVMGSTIYSHGHERSEVALCVQSEEPGTATADAVALVQKAMTSVSKHSNWTLGAYKDQPIRVDAGCPNTPYLLEPGAVHPVLFGGAPPTGKPGRYQAYVVVVPDEKISELFGDSSVRIAPQEMECMGHHCWEVTAALYLTKDELNTPEKLEDGLLRVLGVVQPYDTPPVFGPTNRDKQS
jgi:hypothetical protein